MKSYGVTIQIKATEPFFPVVLFIMLYKAVLTFESVDEMTNMVLACIGRRRSSPFVRMDHIFKSLYKRRFHCLMRVQSID